MANATEKTYLLIPGGWHGAWAFDPVLTRLVGFNKRSYALTLPGLETETVKQDRIINLTMHIEYVINFIMEQDLTNVILCGHSYGGMVIAGVADRVPERINTLVYIDAYIPENGDSCWKLTSEAYREAFVAGAEIDGFTIANRPGSDSRRRPHPLATIMQSITLNGNYKKIAQNVFIYLSGWEGTPFRQQYEKLTGNSGWLIKTIDCEHNVMLQRPDELTAILIEL